MKRVIFVFMAGTLFAWNGTFNTEMYDPRSLALGGACVALPTISAGVILNPAVAGYFRGKEFIASYGRFRDFPVRNGLLGYTVEDNGVAAGGLFWHYTGFKVYDTYDWSENQISYAVAKKIGWHFSLGLSLKLLFVSSDFENGKASGTAADVGFLGDINQIFFYGMSVVNAVSRLNWDTGRKEKLQTGVISGFSIVFNRLNLGVQLKFSGEFEYVSSGLEVWLARDVLALRLGGKYHLVEPSRLVPTGGLSVAVPAGKSNVSAEFGFLYDEKVTGFIERLGIRVFRF